MIQNMYYAPNYQYYTQDKYYNYFNSYPTGYPQMVNTNTYQYYYNNMPAQQYIPPYQHNYYNKYSNMNFVDTYAQSYTNQPKTYDIYNKPNNFEQYSSPVIGENIVYYLDSRSSSRFNLESNNELRTRNNLELKQRRGSVLTTREEDLDAESFLSRTSSELNFTRLSNDEEIFELASSSAEDFAQFSSAMSY